MLARVLAVVVSICLSVCLSVTRWYCGETAALIELIFAYRFSSTYARLCFRVPPKIRVLPFVTFSETLDLRKFRYGRPTVGECDVNSDNERSDVDSTWRKRLTLIARTLYSHRRLPTVGRTGRAVLCTARWSIGREGHRCRAGSISVS